MKLADSNSEEGPDRFLDLVCLEFSVALRWLMMKTLNLQKAIAYSTTFLHFQANSQKSHLSFRFQLSSLLNEIEVL